MDEPTKTNPHPNLILSSNDFEISDFVANLLQDLHDLEEQRENTTSYEQLKMDQEQLIKDQGQLKKDQEQLRRNQEQFKKFQGFILKLSRQIEAADANNRPHLKPALRQGLAREALIKSG
jgi:hypothetical protein